MSSLLSIYLTKEKLKTLSETVEKKGEKGVEITISVSDESNEYGQNVSSYVSQTKEQRESGVKKYYTGNGKVFWTDGKISVGVKNSTRPNEQPRGISDDDDLPF